MNTMQMMISMVLAKDRPNDEKMLYALQGGLQPKSPALNMTSMVGVKKSIEKIEEKEKEIETKKVEIEVGQMRLKAVYDVSTRIFSKIDEDVLNKAIEDAKKDVDENNKNVFEIWSKQLMTIKNSIEQGYPAQLPTSQLVPNNLNDELLTQYIRNK